MAAKFKAAESEEEQKRVLQASLNGQIDACKAKRKEVGKMLQFNIQKVEKFGLARNYKAVLANQRHFIQQNIEVLMQEAPDKADELKENLDRVDEMIRAVELATAPAPKHGE
eukprot:UN2301